MSGCG